MKKTRKFMAASMAAALFASGSLMAAASTTTTTEEQAILAAATKQVPGISTFAAQGKFTDFFPDPTIAQTVASGFGRSVNDTVTLWELMNDVKSLYIGYSNDTIHLDGLEYLHSLEVIHFSNLFGGIDFKDTLNYSKNLKNIIMDFVYHTELPEGLIHSGIESYRIGFGYYHGFWAQSWSVKIPQNLIDAANAKKLKIRLGGGLGTSEEKHAYQIGRPFDTYSMLDAFAKNIIDIEDVQGSRSKIGLSIVKNSGAVPEIDLQQNKTVQASVFDFVRDFNQKVQQELKTPGEYFIQLSIDDEFEKGQYLIPLTVKKPLLYHDLNNTIFANNGSKVHFNGLLSGGFGDGVHTITPTEFSKLGVNMTLNDQLVPYVNQDQYILSCSVTVKDDKIVSITIAGLADPGNFSSFFMLTVAV